MILPYIQQLKNCEIVTLTLPQPQKTDKQGFWLGAKYPNPGISQSDLHYFLSLFLPENTRLILNFVTGHKNFDKLLPQYSEEQDLIFCYDIQYREGKETLFKDIASVHKKFPSADILFKMQTTKIIAMESEKTFSCRWLYNQKENSTLILNGDDASAEILADAYQCVVSENKIPGQ